MVFFSSCLQLTPAVCDGLTEGRLASYRLFYDFFLRVCLQLHVLIAGSLDTRITKSLFLGTIPERWLILGDCAFMSCLHVCWQRVGKAGHVICLRETTFSFTTKAELRFHPLKTDFFVSTYCRSPKHFCFSVLSTSLLSR